MKWLIALLLLLIVLPAGMLVLRVIDPLDRCLDRGGRWNSVENFCEGPDGVDISLTASEPSTSPSS